MIDDEVCKHGRAWDVHCCDCHSGFLFSIMLCKCSGDEMTKSDIVEKIGAAFLRIESAEDSLDEAMTELKRARRELENIPTEPNEIEDDKDEDE